MLFLCQFLHFVFLFWSKFSDASPPRHQNGINKKMFYKDPIGYISPSIEDDPYLNPDAATRSILWEFENEFDRADTKVTEKKAEPAREYFLADPSTPYEDPDFIDYRNPLTMVQQKSQADIENEDNKINIDIFEGQPGEVFRPVHPIHQHRHAILEPARQPAPNKKKVDTVIAEPTQRHIRAQPSPPEENAVENEFNRWEMLQLHSHANPEVEKQSAPHMKKVDIVEGEHPYQAPSTVVPSPIHKKQHENTVYSLTFCIDSDYSLVKELGRGKDGVVSLYQRNRDGKRFAKKVAFQNDKAPQLLLREIRFYNILKGKGVTADFECIAKDGGSFMMEYISGISLDQLDVFEYPGISAETKVMFLAEKIVDIYITLHQLNIVHNDGHMRNWLLDPDTGRLFIIDFGNAFDDYYPSLKFRDIESAGNLLASIYHNYLKQIGSWTSYNRSALVSNKLRNIISVMWPNAQVDFNQLKTLISQPY